MKIKADAQCMQCHLDRNMELARKLGDEEQATVFFRALLKLMLEAPEDMSSPGYAPCTAQLLHEIYGLELDRYKEEKEASNAFVLERMDAFKLYMEVQYIFKVNGLLRLVFLDQIRHRSTDLCGRRSFSELLRCGCFAISDRSRSVASVLAAVTEKLCLQLIDEGLS